MQSLCGFSPAIIVRPVLDGLNLWTRISRALGRVVASEQK